MKIKSVGAYLLSYPFAEPVRLAFHGGERTILKRDAMFIRIEADNGLVGYAPGPASEQARHMVERIIAPFLGGRTIADIDALRVHFMEGPGVLPEMAKMYCCAEIALYDLLGKALGVPVSELLGEKIRDRILLYGSGGMYMPPQGYADEAAAIASDGFRAYKMRPGRGPDEDLEAVRLMREAAGPDFDLMIDAHTWWRMGDRSYTIDTVERLAEGMASYNIAWLEEPIPPDDHAAYVRLKEKDIVPLASGEHEPGEEEFLDLILSRAVDYVQMDICCQGGYTLGRKLFAEIERQELRFAFHSWGTALELAAAAQAGVCWPESVVEWLEYPCHATDQRTGMYPFPLAEELLTERLEVEKGELVVPRGPGLGVTVDESVVDRYPWLPGPWSYFRIDSPPETRAVTADHSVPWATNHR